MGCLLSTPDVGGGGQKEAQKYWGNRSFSSWTENSKATLFCSATWRFTLTDLKQALEDYLPVLLGLVENDNRQKHSLRFCWINQEDDMEETTMSDSWYEGWPSLILYSLEEPSSLVEIPTDPKVIGTSGNECKRASIDIFLKAAGYLDFAVQKVLPQLPLELRNDLPLDLTEGVLKSLCLQALGQGVEIQLGMAIVSVKATLAVKRGLACQMVKYWHQAHEFIKDLPLANGRGEKNKLFVQCKHIEAKIVTVSSYNHLLMVGVLNMNITHPSYVPGCRILSARINPRIREHICRHDCGCSPSSRKEHCSLSRSWKSIFTYTIPIVFGPVILLWGSSKIMQIAPALPDFVLSLKPDEYQLPSMDPSWDEVQNPAN
ncbi:Detected protein of unknown function [Hibiscus syriacus]|uniref:Uncharacterized protein n=1 Tax=Hibiscus syriacus TaxID=106335 RepID=A0A6A2XZ55_HIBSY|nr:Detected protein of unknown function [Hibiscus syriacus]